ncbi:MAG: phosphonoacetaldehyde reductase [Ignavibacteriae bacterium]|nr:phosphonoacetaldehyde reductase [Ignavibacteriota bacterium]
MLKKLNKKNILLVTGRDSYTQSGAKKKIMPFLNNLNIIHFFDFQTNPSFEDVKKGVEIFNQNKCEVIVAIGGGSVIDMAKLIKYYNNTDIRSITENNLLDFNLKPLPIICIPTTAGSGSEATHFAVMYIGFKKFSIANQVLLPNHVIIDPELHYSLSKEQIALSGIDAFCQGIESMWSINANQESQEYSEIAIRLLWRNLKNAIVFGNEVSHLNVAVGSNFAGRAINITKTTAPHAISYILTKIYGIAHGNAVAITLPAFFLYNLTFKKFEKNKYQTQDSFSQRLLVTLDAKTPEQGKLKIEKLIKEIGLKTKLSELDNFHKEDIAYIVENINIERLSNNPKSISKLELYALLENVI